MSDAVFLAEGGTGTRSIGGGHAANQANIAQDVLGAVSNVATILGAGSPSPLSIGFLWNGGESGLFLNLGFLSQFFGGGDDDPPPVPYQLKHGRHPVYDRVLGISPSLVPTQATVAPVGPGPLPPLRSPDFYTAEVNVGPLVGVSVDVSIDRYGRLYFAPGVELGKSPTLVAGSLTAGYLNQASTPSAAQLHNFLTGHSGNVGGGFLLGAGETYTPGVGTATQVGVFSPQFGLAYHYGFEWR